MKKVELRGRLRFVLNHLEKCLEYDENKLVVIEKHEAEIPRHVDIAHCASKIILRKRIEIHKNSIEHLKKILE